MAQRNVKKESVSLIQLPTPAQREDRGLKLCANPFIVLADTIDFTSWKNDRTGIAFKVDDLTIELEDENGNTEPAPGMQINFPHQADAKGFVIDWRHYVDGQGKLKTGCYKIKVNYELAGFNDFFYYGSYNLLPYSAEISEGTCRVLVVLNDFVRDEGINYRESGFADSIRFKGFFGAMQPNPEVENLIKVNRQREKVRIEALRSYQLKSNYIIECFTKRLDFDHLLAASQIYISDYNKYNHSEYKDFPVILNEEGYEYQYSEGTPYASILANFVDKKAYWESKYDGNIQGSDNIILDLPQGSPGAQCEDADYTIQYEDGVIYQQGSIPSGGSETITVPERWWKRNPEWLPMPNITAGDNKFAGLFAVYENELNILSIDKDSGVSLVDWGDGNTENSSGLIQHTYDYAAISSPILQDQIGFNYKMVIVEINIPENSLALKITNATTPPKAGGSPSQNWLDIIINNSTNGNFVFGYSDYNFRLLERVVIVGEITLGFKFTNAYKLKVFDYNYNAYPIGFGANCFENSGDLRRSNGEPIDINLTGLSLGSYFLGSQTTKVGDVVAGDLKNAFQNSNVQEIGNITLNTGADLYRTFWQAKYLRKIGDITINHPIDDLNQTFRDAFIIERIVFVAGSSDLSNVSNTIFSFNNCEQLKILILPGLRLGFDIHWSKITGQNLQDLGNSLDNADGAQTITLPAFVNGQDVSVFTNKGYTIAYA